MADFLRLANTLVNLDRVEAVRLDQPRPPGKPGKCHKILFCVGPTTYEDRDLSFHEDSDEGIALRRWADGLDDLHEIDPALDRRLASLLDVPAPDGPVTIQPLRCCRADGFAGPVAEACQDEGRAS